jgi:riboflavin kinase/FMN adenylyltransferase
MKVYKSLNELQGIRRSGVLTIGNFDGVHLGHREILGTAKTLAEQQGTNLTAITFEPHPVSILHPEKAPGVLTPLNLKLPLLAEYADECLILHLTESKALLGLSAEAFVDQVIMRHLSPSVIVEGHDFNFGTGREGNVRTLNELGQKRGFAVKVVEPKQMTLSTGQTLRVSSTMIRYMLESGHVAEAAVGLMRPYRLFGRIVSGRGKGKELGYPTLNMERPGQVLPSEGVYAGYVQLSQTGEPCSGHPNPVPAVFSLGQASTFGDNHPLLIESHLLCEYDGQHGEKWMAMDFVQRLRSQHKYRTIEDLILQIGKDCIAAKEVLQD